MPVVPVGDRAGYAELLSQETGGYPPAELDAMVSLESSWDTSARNPSTSAAGLIQIMPNHLKRWGLTVEQLTSMSAREQLPWIHQYFRDANAYGRWRVPGDTYLAVAAPSALGKPDSTVVYGQGTKAWRANPGWRPADGGSITAGSIRAVLLRRMGGMAPAPRKAPPRKAPPEPLFSGLSNVPWWVLAGVAWLAGRELDRRRR